MSVPLPAHLSPTSWNKWDACPRAWRYRYVDKVEDPPSVATETGSFAHRVFDLLMLTYHVDRTLTLARHLAADIWHRGNDASFNGTWHQRLCTPREFKRIAWSHIVGLWTVEDPTRVAVVATERRVEWTVQGVPMVAIVDRVERNSAGLLTISDYKTSREYKPKYQAGPKRQVAIGALAVGHEEGLRQVGDKGKLLYVSAEKVEPAPTDAATLAGVAAQAEATWLEITEACATDDFPPRTSPLCSYCAHVAECPEGQSQVRRSLYFRNPPPPDAPGVVALAALEAA